MIGTLRYVTFRHLILKGIIYINDLSGITGSEVVNELNGQNVCEVMEIMKYINNQNVET